MNKNWIPARNDNSLDMQIHFAIALLVELIGSDKAYITADEIQSSYMPNETKVLSALKDVISLEQH